MQLSAARPQPLPGLARRAVPARDPRQARDVSAVVASERSAPRASPDKPMVADRNVAENKRGAAGGRTLVVRGPERVRDCVLSMEQPDRNLGAEPRSNPLRRADTGAPLLIRFDLSQVELQESQVTGARVVLYVWDPSQQGRTRVAVSEPLVRWKADEATWKQASASQPWSGGTAFSLHKDAGEPFGDLIVEPDEPGTDTLDPPRAIEIDVTQSVRRWLADPTSNRGLVLCPVVDREIDEGYHTRFQVYASEYANQDWIPRLEILAR
jgi:hypothetical protein